MATIKAAASTAKTTATKTTATPAKSAPAKIDTKDKVSVAKKEESADTSSKMNYNALKENTSSGESKSSKASGKSDKTDKAGKADKADKAHDGEDCRCIKPHENDETEGTDEAAKEAEQKELREKQELYEAKVKVNQANQELNDKRIDQLTQDIEEAAKSGDKAKLAELTGQMETLTGRSRYLDEQFKYLDGSLNKIKEQLPQESNISMTVEPMFNYAAMGQAAVDQGSQYLGAYSADLAGNLPSFQAAGGVTNNCVDFVSSLLENQGLIDEHYTYVPYFKEGLEQRGYTAVPVEQARPGDVWLSDGHAEIVKSNDNGFITLIGSNGDAVQYITEDDYLGNYGGGTIYQKQ